jgi:hypothetical protein
MRAAWVVVGLLIAGLLVAGAQPAHADCDPLVHLSGPDDALIAAVAAQLEDHGVRAYITAADDSTEWGCVEHEVAIAHHHGAVEVVARDPRGERVVRKVRSVETAAAWVESWVATTTEGVRPGDASQWALGLRMELGGGNDTSTSLGPAITLSRALGVAMEVDLTLRVQTGWIDLLGFGGVVQPYARGNFDAVLTLAVRQDVGAVTVLYGLGGGVRALFGRFNNLVPAVEPSITARVPLTLRLAGEVRASGQLLWPDGPPELDTPEWLNGRIAIGLRWTLP